MAHDLRRKQTLSSFALKRKKDENEVSRNKRAKTNVNAQDRLACLKVSYKAYTDIQERFKVLYLPECIDNKCIHITRNAKAKQISAAAERDFNIEMKNRIWFEAIEVCLMCVSSHWYLSENVLKCVVEIILNAHEDNSSGYTIEYILRQCQHALLLNFNLHPPCISKDIRDCYKKFLTSPIDKKEKSLSNRIKYHSEQGIVSHCFSRLIYEISMESRDDTLLEKPEVPNEISDAIKKGHWMEENFELFEFLVRTDRIERLMMVLECIINLLQTDLALWHSRSVNKSSQMRSQKPLLDYVLWPSTSKSQMRNVTDQCRIIIKIFAYFIHLKYPEQHIKTMSLWMNTVIQMYYLCDIRSHEDYPNINNYYCQIFAKEFCKIISSLPTVSISKIMEKVQSSFMRHLIGLRQIQQMLNTNEDNIIHVIISSINNSWENIPYKDIEGTLPVFDCTRTMESHKLLDILSEKCRNVVSIGQSSNTSINPYYKFDLKKENCETRNNGNDIINLLFITFPAYIESYDILNFRQTLEYLNSKLDNPSSSEEFEESTYKPYCISIYFFQKYQSIIKSLEELKSLLCEKDDERSKKLLKIINRFLPYILFYCYIVP